jgi:hypothetical protein
MLLCYMPDQRMTPQQEYQQTSQKINKHYCNNEYNKNISNNVYCAQFNFFLSENVVRFPVLKIIRLACVRFETSAFVCLMC